MLFPVLLPLLHAHTTGCHNVFPFLQASGNHNVIPFILRPHLSPIGIVQPFVNFINPHIRLLKSST